MQQDFRTSLKNGEFRIPVCVSCGSVAWPPSTSCSKCFAQTRLKKTSKTGILLEFTTSHVTGKEGVFGLVKIGKIRIIGSFGSQQLREGMTVKMTGCGFLHDGMPYYRFDPVSTRH